MANPRHVEVLDQGVGVWNAWRQQHPRVRPDLSTMSLHGRRLKGVDFSRTLLKNSDLGEADLTGAILRDAGLYNVDGRGTRLDRADLQRAERGRSVFEGASAQQTRFDGTSMRQSCFVQADLNGSSMRRVDLTGAFLSEAGLRRADFRDANLSGADHRCSYLGNSWLVRANVEGATFECCRVHGISAWDLVGTPRLQKDLIVTPESEPEITVDDLEVAQFVYFVCNNRKIRNVLNAFTDKNVLILGRFSPPERKAMLDGLRERLRTFNLVPIVFDFDHPQDKDFTETVQTLAGMSMFVIVDVTNPKSTPLEMEATVKQFKIPYVPIIDSSVDARPFAMMVDLHKSFHWVLPTLAYQTKQELFEHLGLAIVDRARHEHRQLREIKATESVAMLSIADLTRERSKGPNGKRARSS